MIVGEGKYRYRVVEGWGKLPEGLNWGTATDSIRICHPLLQRARSRASASGTALANY